MFKRPAKVSHVVVAMGAIAAIAIAVPALGLDRSIKKAIKKEVSKQIGKATGPAGTPGTAGAAGAAGTARAYARVEPHTINSCDTPPQTCAFDRAKGISGVRRVGVGQYCVTAPGISANPAGPPAAVSVDITGSLEPVGNASVAIAHGVFCSTAEFKVRTDRQPDLGAGHAGNAVPADDVGFTIVIP
jgi:hypothetical protein